jgi:hypothetical protein
MKPQRTDSFHEVTGKEPTVFQKGIWPELGFFKISSYISESVIYQDCFFDFVPISLRTAWEPSVIKCHTGNFQLKIQVHFRCRVPPEEQGVPEVSGLARSRWSRSGAYFWNSPTLRVLARFFILDFFFLWYPPGLWFSVSKIGWCIQLVNINPRQPMRLRTQ